MMFTVTAIAPLNKDESFSGGIFRSRGTALSSVKEELLCAFLFQTFFIQYFRYVLRDLKIQSQIFIKFLFETCVTENIG